MNSGVVSVISSIEKYDANLITLYFKLLNVRLKSTSLCFIIIFLEYLFKILIKFGQLTFDLKPRRNDLEYKCHGTPRCTTWNEETQEWLDYGCVHENVNAYIDKCICNHTGHFAIVEYYKVRLSIYMNRTNFH